MATESPLLMRRFHVGDEFVCTITVPRPQAGQVVAMSVEWAPHLPKHLSWQERQDYRKGRDAVVAEIGQALGISLAVVEI